MAEAIRGAAAPTSGLQDHVSLDTHALDQAVADVTARALAWAATSVADRVTLLETMIADTYAVAEEWAAAGSRAKGYESFSTEGGEELFSGVGTFLRMMQAFATSLRDIQRSGRPHYPGPVTAKPGNRLAVRVMPASTFDKVLYSGMSGEVWMEPGVTEEEIQATQAELYQNPSAHAGVSLVLGAGNVASLGPRDVLTKLFAEGKVVVLKANPVNDYLVPYWERAMGALITAGFLRIVSGGAAVGAYLTGHDDVDDIHVTGSDKTVEAIVFGVGDEGARRKASNDPIITKPVSCELGNVSPVIIVPGKWSRKEMAYQAAHVATMFTNNAGFNCLTPRVIVTHSQWAQREEFLAALEATLAAIPTREAYYPGAADRHASFLAAHPDARQIGAANGRALPWTLIRDVPASNVNDMCFNVEAFCSVTSEAVLDADGAVDFIEKAVTFCNDVVWGTLSATVIVDTATLKDELTGAAVEQAIADLKYGSIGLNLWHAMSFAFSTTVWGAYPGHPLTDIQSGRGFVGNAFMFARPQKSVVRGPFRVSPTPAWFATNKNASQVMRRFLAFEASPRWSKIPALLLAALKG
jgi:acyl-CoA reductase-like NAD-dependent aldehyde dehydrogenase